MVADPEVKLIMPARLFTGLADDDPIFQYVRQVIQQPAGTVEVTLKAGLDDLGSAIESLQRIYVAPIQEVPIPILVPLASSAEINARIFDWKQWKQVEEKAGRSDNAGKADAFIAKLTEYQNAADRVRLLRGALATHVLDLYEPQQKIREYFADWYKKNGTLLQQAMERAVQRRELTRIWRLKSPVLSRSMVKALVPRLRSVAASTSSVSWNSAKSKESAMTFMVTVSVAEVAALTVAESEKVRVSPRSMD
jgi:hypothetical protein